MPNQTTSTPSADEIAEVILKRASLAPQVLGAQLGNSVRQAFPYFDLKMEYGSLQTFIGKHCRGRLFWVGKSGPDDVYTTIAPERTLDTARDGDATFWQAFANPERNFIPAINPTDGRLATIAVGDPIPEGFVDVGKLTEDEHRNFAKEFLLFVNHQDRFALAPILSKQNFWPEWAERITSQAFGKYRSKWLTFRFHRIFNSLDARLSALGVPESLKTRVLEQVKETKTPRLPQNSKVSQSVPSSTQNASGESVATLRELAHKAVDLMNEDELRKLWVPLGALGNALKPK